MEIWKEGNFVSFVRHHDILRFNLWTAGLVGGAADHHSAVARVIPIRATRHSREIGRIAAITVWSHEIYSGTQSLVLQWSFGRLYCYTVAHTTESIWIVSAVSSSSQGHCFISYEGVVLPPPAAPLELPAIGLGLL